MRITRREFLAAAGILSGVLGITAFIKREGIKRRAHDALDLLFDDSPGKRTTTQKSLLEIVREQAHVQERAPDKKQTLLYFGQDHNYGTTYTQQAIQSQLEIFRIIELLIERNFLSAIYIELPEGQYRNPKLAALESLSAEKDPKDERLKKLMLKHNLLAQHLIYLRTPFREQYGFLTAQATEASGKAPETDINALNKRLSKGIDGQLTFTKQEVDDAYRLCENHLGCVNAFTNDSLFNVEKLSRNVPGDIAVIAGAQHAEQARRMGETALAPILARYNLVHVTTPNTPRPDTAAHYAKLYFFEELKARMTREKLDVVTTRLF